MTTRRRRCRRVSGAKLLEPRAIDWPGWVRGSPTASLPLVSVGDEVQLDVDASVEQGIGFGPSLPSPGQTRPDELFEIVSPCDDRDGPVITPEATLSIEVFVSNLPILVTSGWSPVGVPSVLMSRLR